MAENKRSIHDIRHSPLFECIPSQGTTDEQPNSQNNSLRQLSNSQRNNNNNTNTSNNNINNINVQSPPHRLPPLVPSPAASPTKKENELLAVHAKLSSPLTQSVFSSLTSGVPESSPSSTRSSRSGKERRHSDPTQVSHNDNKDPLTMEGPHKYHPPHRRYTQCLPSELPGDASQSSHNANHFCTSILSLDPAKEDGANSTNASDALQHTKQNMETIPCKLPAVVMSVADVGAGSRRCRESAISFSEETHHTPNHNSNNNNKHSSIPMDSTLLTDSVEYDVHFISPNATNNNSTMNTNNNNMNNNNNNYKPRQLGVARHPADISTTSRYGNPSRFLSTANISSSMNANSNSIPVAGDSSSHLHGDCTPEKPTSFHIKDVLHVHRGEEGFTGGEMQQWLHGGENGQKKPFTLRVPLYALTTLILVVMVAIIGSLSIVPLDHVAGKSIDRVSVLLSGSLGNSVSDAIQSSLYYLPMSVKGFTTGWLVDSTTRTWPWTEDDMPQAMRQLCESIALSQSSHLLYLSISSPISGYGAYCSGQYEPGKLVGQHTSRNATSPRYMVDPSTYTYQQPLEPFTAVKDMNQYDYTVVFGEGHNAWSKVALPWWQRYQAGETPSALATTIGWSLVTEGDMTVITYSIPFVDYQGNLAMISGAMQTDGLQELFPEGYIASRGRVMVVDPVSGAVLLNSWQDGSRAVLDNWNPDSPSSEPYRTVDQLHLSEIKDPFVMKAVQELGGWQGLASRPISVRRWSVRFRDEGWFSLAFVQRIVIGDASNPMNLLVVYAIRRSDYFENIESTRIAVIVSIVVILFIIVCLTCVLVYIFLQPIRELGKGLREAAQLRSSESISRLSIILEIAEMQTNFLMMREQLMRMKTFLPQGLLGAASAYAESDERGIGDGDYSRVDPLGDSTRYALSLSQRDANSNLSFSHRPPMPPMPSRDTGGDTVVPILDGPRTEVGPHLHLNGRVLLDEVNCFRRRYCTLMTLTVHVREKEIRAGKFQPLVSAFLECAIPHVLQYGGVIEVQRPDYLLISFGAHSRVAMHQSRAANCALSILSTAYTGRNAMLIAHRIGCFLDVGECYVGTCGAADRNARVAYGGRLPVQSDLVKMSQTLRCPILLTQRLAATLDDHLLTAPVDSLILPLHSSSTILYELRGSSRALPPGVSETDIRLTLQCLRTAFSRMVRGEYTTALELLEPFQDKDAQVARLLELCWSLVESGTTKPFVRSIGRIRFNENDCEYDSTADATRPARVSGEHGATGESTTQATVTTGDNMSVRMLHSSSAGQTNNEVSAFSVQSAPVNIFGIPSNPTVDTNTLLLLMDNPNKQGAFRSAAGHDEEQLSNSGSALFEMFVEPEDNQSIMEHDCSIQSSLGSVLGGGGGPLTVQASTVVEGELPLHLVDCDGGVWTRSQKRLGSGATGVVYRGLSQSGSLVALKCFQLCSRDIDKTVVVDEVRLLASLHHENIVQYISVYVSEYYLVEIMELVPGGSLDTLLLNFGALSVVSVRRYLQDILLGLNYLHSMGIVHCDVKPHNVLLAMEGQCKLSDFGSALSRAATSQCDEDGFLQLRGTPGYMAPEVARGELPTAKSDVFSLGVTLLELLCGELPWAYVSDEPQSVSGSPDHSARDGSDTVMSGDAFTNPIELDITSLLSPKALRSEGSGHLLNQVKERKNDSSHDSSNSNTAVFASYFSPTRSGNRQNARQKNKRMPLEKLLSKPSDLIIAIGRGEVLPVVPEGLPEDVRVFLTGCVQEKPEDRPTVEALLHYDWVM